MECTVEFYRNKNGRSPVVEFLDELEAKKANSVLEALELLKTFGIELKEPHVKFLEDKIYELRVKEDREHYRLLYFLASRRKFVILHGFIKKTNKTPRREIEKAKKRMKEYLGNG